MKTEIDTNEVQILENLDWWQNPEKQAAASKLVEGGLHNDEVLCVIKGETAKRIVEASGFTPMHWPQPKESDEIS
jgi:hypothetical protein